METTQRSWAFDRPPSSSPFALPSGRMGRLAGAVMLRTNKGGQEGVLGLLGVRPGWRVLEVGYGPGGLVRLLADRTEAAHIQGIDPSEVMRDAASRLNRAAIRAGRVELGLGTAADTGLAERSVDLVVSVNNIAIWPDLEAGVHELHRVVRPGGAVVVAWHGGTDPARIARRLRLTDDRLDRVQGAFDELFDEVARHRLKNLEVFKAVRSRDRE